MHWGMYLFGPLWWFFGAVAAIEFVRQREHDNYALKSRWILPSGDAVNISIRPAGLYVQDAYVENGIKADVYTSWTLMTVVYNDPYTRKQFQKLAQALQHSLADSLDICRTAVRVTDLQAARVDFLVDNAYGGKLASDLEVRRQKTKPASLMRQIQNFVMHSTTEDLAAQDFDYVNMTQVKGIYEILYFEEIGIPGPMLAQKIDSLQIYHKFSDFSLELSRTIGDECPVFADAVMLDDVGFATQQNFRRKSLTAEQREACIEENLLRKSRRDHQFVFAFALILSVLITCAGSTVFAIKAPSTVPSLANPLSASMMRD